MATNVMTVVDKIAQEMDAHQLQMGNVTIPKLTTAARDALVGVPSGYLVYNTTTNKVNVRVAAAWEAITSV